jgi:hypothetical protein
LELLLKQLDREINEIVESFNLVSTEADSMSFSIAAESVNNLSAAWKQRQNEILLMPPNFIVNINRVPSAGLEKRVNSRLTYKEESTFETAFGSSNSYSLKAVVAIICEKRPL